MGLEFGSYLKNMLWILFSFLQLFLQDMVNWAQRFPYSFAAWYTPLSHVLLHADWTHLIFNMAWMLAFGSPVAMRIGTMRFLALACVGALIAFLFHLITHLDQYGPMLGASGAVSAFMGAAIRLQRGGNIDGSTRVLGLIESFNNRGFLAFVGIWFLVNLLIGLMPGLIADGDAQIAWQAHIGGFLTGILAFKLFDPGDPSSQKHESS